MVPMSTVWLWVTSQEGSWWLEEKTGRSTCGQLENHIALWLVLGGKPINKPHMYMCVNKLCIAQFIQTGWIFVEYLIFLFVIQNFRFRTAGINIIPSYSNCTSIQPLQLPVAIGNVVQFAEDIFLFSAALFIKIELKTVWKWILKLHLYYHILTVSGMTANMCKFPVLREFHDTCFVNILDYKEVTSLYNIES